MNTYSDSALITTTYPAGARDRKMGTHGRARHAAGAGLFSLPSFVLGAALALLFALSGCKSSSPAPGTVLLNDHVRSVAPGEAVPPLPAGETRWWLCTPAGLRQLLPADAPVNRLEATP